MSFTTDELRDALHAYAEDVPLADPEALIAGAGRKRDHARKIRTAVIAGAAAVLMAVVTVIGIQGIGHEKALTPAQLNKKHHTHYAEYTHGLKLTDVIDVPVHHTPDIETAQEESAPAGLIDVTLPHVGSAVYLQCDARYFMGQTAGYSADAEVRGSHNVGASCSNHTPLLTNAEPGTRTQLWVATPDRHNSSHAPVAVYTQVPWKDYPKTSTALRPQPNALDPKKPPYGSYAVVISGSGNSSSTKTFRVPAKADTLGAALTVHPSTTGRFQVLVDGKAQRLDYTGLPAKYGRLGFGVPPEVRGTWLDYFTDSASGNIASGAVSGAKFRGAPAGKSITVTIRAVDTKGPWKAMLSWQKKQG